MNNAFSVREVLQRSACDVSVPSSSLHHDRSSNVASMVESAHWHCSSSICNHVTLRARRADYDLIFASIFFRCDDFYLLYDILRGK